MAKSKTNSFILELKLNTETYQTHILNKRFEIARQIYNSTLSFALKKFRLMKENKAYKEALHKYIDAKTKENKKVYSNLLNSIRLDFSMSEYSLYSYVKNLQHNYKTHIDSQAAQKIASAVWKAIDSILFKKGKKVHFKKFGELTSIEGSSNSTGIKFRNNTLVWNGLNIPVIIRKNDLFVQESLTNRVKFCRIVKKIIRGKDTFYLQLVLEGIPPVKKVNSTGEFRHSFNSGRVGLDIGTSTIAVASKNEVALKALGTTMPKIEKELNMNLRKLDRSRRQTNPENFNPDGTIKRGIKLEWYKSKSYIKTSTKIKELYRLKANKLKMEHNILANYILSLGDEIYVEQMNFKALAKRSKNTTVNSKGKFNSKKRFGSSIGNFAPSMLLTIIDRKLQYQGIKLNKINTRTFKASQYNHVTDNYKKKKLSQRWTNINDHKIQRDLYSSFLIMNSNATLTKADRDLCLTEFNNFIKLHDIVIEEIKNISEKTPSSFGIKRAA